MLALAAWPAAALDKQGSAHGGSSSADGEGVNLSGAVSLGASLYNPTYAARPDNTGLTLLRYAAHFDLDILGQKLSLPLDINFFTDRLRPGLQKLAPSEFDVIAGVTSTWNVGSGAVEVGTRVEHDRPVDGTFTQTYVDARARYLYSFADVFPRMADALKDGDISGWVTLGWFAFNPTYAARPDNTGLALFRYALHTELTMFHDILGFGVDTTFFTDREAPVVVRPSELDLTAEIIGRWSPWELHVAYERDMPLDRGGLIQSFVYALAVYTFDLKHSQPAPMERRNAPVSP